MNVLKSHPKRLTFTEFFEFVYYNYDKHSENVIITMINIVKMFIINI